MRACSSLPEFTDFSDISGRSCTISAVNATFGRFFLSASHPLHGKRDFGASHSAGTSASASARLLEAGPGPGHQGLGEDGGPGLCAAEAGAQRRAPAGAAVGLRLACRGSVVQYP